MMPAATSSTFWGEWVLGDLADCLRIIAEILGGTTSVPRVVLETPPPDEKGRPTVTVQLANLHQMGQARHEVLGSGYELGPYICSPDESHWATEVAGVYLVLTVKGDQG